jgi:hypothetical protein
MFECRCSPAHLGRTQRPAWSGASAFNRLAIWGFFIHNEASLKFTDIPFSSDEIQLQIL